MKSSSAIVFERIEVSTTSVGMAKGSASELGECQGEAQEFCDGRRWPVVTAEHAARLAGVVTIVEATR